ncbi:hypothetical protein D3C84_897820 [compost metagenome]
MGALQHGFLIVADHLAADGFFHCLSVAQVPGRHHETRHQAFQVPFPGAGVGFLKVIHAKQQIALGCGKTAEIHQVAIATDRRYQAHVGCSGQVMRLQQGVASIEGEWRR